MNTQSVDVKIDGAVHSLDVSPSDNVQTMIQQISKKMNIPPMFIFLIKKDSLTKVEKIEDLPFKSVKRYVEINDLTNSNLEFQTLEPVANQKTFQGALDIVKAHVEGTDAVMTAFYYFYKKPNNAEFIEKGGSEEFRAKYEESANLLTRLNERRFPNINGVKSFIQMYENFYKRVEESLLNVTKYLSLSEISQKTAKFQKQTRENEKLITPTKVSFTNIKCNLRGMQIRDEYELFNDAILSNDVPLIYINGFYKVLKGFSIDNSWIAKIQDYIENEKQKHHLILFVLNKHNYNKFFKKENFSLISAFVQNEEIVVNINSQIEDFNQSTDLKEEQLLTRVCNALLIEQSEVDVNIFPQNLKCFFYITKTLIEKMFYYDLVMNNDIVSDFFCANERFRIFNKRGGVQTVFKQCESVFSLQSMLVTRPLRKKIGSVVKVNETVVEIRVSYAKNLTEVDLLKKYLSLMTSIYNEEKKCLENIYSNIPRFENDRRDVLIEGKQERPAKMTLASYDPELFVEGYPKRCNKSPKIIEDEEEAKEKIKEGIDIMKYPLFDEFKTHYYSCEHRSGYPHPGLIKTDLTTWPLPCCFEVDQTEKKNAVRYMYENKVPFSDETSSKKGKFTILQTSHTLKKDSIGKLPKDIDNYFRVIDSNNLYIRHYVPMSPRSVILAIATAMKNKKLLKYFYF